MRCATHVLLHQAHAGRRFEIETAGIEACAFTDQRDTRRAGIAPGKMHEPRRFRGGAADSMDQRIILREQIVANDGVDLRAVALRQRRGGRVQRDRPHVVGRRVDEIAHQPAGFHEARGFLHVRAFGRNEHRGGALALFVAIERVGPETPGDG